MGFIIFFLIHLLLLLLAFIRANSCLTIIRRKKQLTTYLAIVEILFVLIYDRSQIHIGTILYQIVYSLCVDMFAQMHVYSKYMWLNMLIMLVGIVLFAVGTGLYAAADLGRGSYEAVTFALAERNHWQVKKVRMILDAAMVVIGVILGGKFGVCTVVTVIISGPIIQFTVGRAKRIIKL